MTDGSPHVAPVAADPRVIAQVPISLSWNPCADTNPVVPARRRVTREATRTGLMIEPPLLEL
jgi:hypothetical protein